jgi:hypothetical protein
MIPVPLYLYHIFSPWQCCGSGSRTRDYDKKCKLSFTVGKKLKLHIFKSINTHPTGNFSNSVTKIMTHDLRMPSDEGQFNHTTFS